MSHILFHFNLLVVLGLLDDINLLAELILTGLQTISAHCVVANEDLPFTLLPLAKTPEGIDLAN